MGTISGEERRKAERSVRDDYTLNLSSGGRPYGDVQLRDVSTRGIGLQVGGDLKVGQQLNVELFVPGGSITATASVVWAEPFHMGYRGGAKFTSLGWFGRRKLARSLGGKDGRDSWFDLILIAIAAGLGALVAVDLLK
ncbi:MAG: hypothetical protein FD126_2615 [Elusimicrobia bacterium]|nr:MAG: hypothetical protein FD126_2615 [Elusimicrobiota bacterium]